MDRFASRKFLSMFGMVCTDLGAVLSGHTDPASIGALALATIAVIAYIHGEAKVDAANAGAGTGVAAVAAMATGPQ